VARSISAVRIRDLPFDVACLGVVVWSGAEVVDVLGYKLVYSLAGVSGEGDDITVLTIVQPRSVAALDDFNMRRVQAFAEGWFKRKNR
jgi:hypothetical protein